MFQDNDQQKVFQSSWTSLNYKVQLHWVPLFTAFLHTYFADSQTVETYLKTYAEENINL